MSNKTTNRSSSAILKFSLPVISVDNLDTLLINYKKQMLFLIIAVPIEASEQECVDRQIMRTYPGL